MNKGKEVLIHITFGFPITQGREHMLPPLCFKECWPFGYVDYLYPPYVDVPTDNKDIDA